MFLSSYSVGLRVPLRAWQGTCVPLKLGEYSGFFSTCGGASSGVSQGSSSLAAAVQGGSCLVAMCGWSLTSFGMISLVVVGVNSVVVVDPIF